MKPLVSFLMPAYNAAKHLPETLHSVLAQSHSNFEVIVVNDGSRDDTSAVARAIGDSRIKVIDQENCGQSASENVAFQASQGDFIVHLDADDLISPNKLETQLRRLETAEPDCVAFHPWGRFNDDPSRYKPVPEPFWRDIAPIDFHIEMWERHSMIQGACYLIPRRLVERAGPWDKTLSLINDFDFFPRVLLQAPKLLFCPEATLFYRSGSPNVLSASKSPAAWDSAYRSTVSGTTLLLSKENSPRSTRAACRAFEEFVYAAYPSVPHLRRLASKRIKELGGPYFAPQLGPKMRAVSRLVGWKGAKRLQTLAKLISSKLRG